MDILSIFWGWICEKLKHIPSLKLENTMLINKNLYSAHKMQYLAEQLYQNVNKIMLLRLVSQLKSNS